MSVETKHLPIKIMCLALYYGFAQFLPSSSFAWGGGDFQKKSATYFAGGFLKSVGKM